MAAAGLGVIPIVGDIMGALLNGMIDKFKESKKFEDRCNCLRDELPKLVMELEAYDDPSNLAQRAFETATALNDLVQDREIETTWWRRFKEGKRRKDFKEKLDTLKRELEQVQQMVLMRIHDDTHSTRVTVERMEPKMDVVDTKMDGLGVKMDGLSDQIARLRTLPQKEEFGNGVTVAAYPPEVIEALNIIEYGKPDERPNALRYVGSFSMKLVNEGSASSLSLLEDLIGYPGVLSAIMKQLIRKCQWLATQPNPIELSQWQRAIKDANLIPLIVRNSQDDFNALRLLYEISNTDNCKSAIVQAGGIAKLVKIYQSRRMSKEGVDGDVILVIETLANLSYDEDCREKLVENRNVWSLLHFIWRCSTINTSFKFCWAEWNWFYEGPESFDEAPNYLQDAVLNTPYPVHDAEWDESHVVPTKFVREHVLQTEQKASEALLNLIQVDENCKRCILELGAFFLSWSTALRDPNYSKRQCILELDWRPDHPRRPDSDEEYPLFDAIHGWLEMAKAVKKRQWEEKAETYWFVHILWKLLLDKEPQALVAELCYKTELSVAFTLFRVARHKQMSKDIDFNSIVEDYSPAEPEFLPHLFTDAETQLSGSICDHLAISSRNFRQFDSCLREVIRLSRDGDSAQRAKAFGVLWLCVRFLADAPIDFNLVTESCARAISDEERSADEIYGATSLLLGVLSLDPQGNHQQEFRLKLAVSGVNRLLQTDERQKYVFLANYLLRKSQPEDMQPSCIPFVLSCFMTIKSSEGVGSDTVQLQQRCLAQLAHFWPNHKQQIVEAAEASVLKAMLVQRHIDPATKQDIKQILEDAAP
ncbi:hypothetical protein PHYBOEH_008062 [Phytophthora boehmeriae]|uniref:Uncharacterized protein n=1 Tax=Phytophthora boehmeriae TaxID=109152 RepID=A0A8T1X5U0_9STRA|nr:hypothetical protein PHYBOEH_008062 [Phytophthora boehmeriae]